MEGPFAEHENAASSEGEEKPKLSERKRGRRTRAREVGGGEGKDWGFLPLMRGVWEGRAKKGR